MSNVYESIMRGLKEALNDAKKENIKLPRRTITAVFTNEEETREIRSTGKREKSLKN